MYYIKSYWFFIYLLTALAYGESLINDDGRIIVPSVAPLNSVININPWREASVGTPMSKLSQQWPTYEILATGAKRKNGNSWQNQHKFGFIFLGENSEDLPIRKLLTFYIWEENGIIAEKYDPFGGVYSKAGLPTQVRILSLGATAVLGLDRSLGDRVILDIRWWPSDGTYPIWYDLDFVKDDGETELGVTTPGLKYTWMPLKSRLKTDRTSSVRIRSRNTFGFSEWRNYIIEMPE